MEIIITGGNGYISENIVHVLKKKNRIILLYKKSINPKFKKNYQTIKFDLRKKKLPYLTCDILIHTAGITPQKKYNQKKFMDINYYGFKRLVKHIKIKKKLIYLSTTDIYKGQGNLISVEENKKINLKNISPYAKSKFFTEEFIKNLNPLSHPYEKIILRLPGIVGDNNHINFISNIVKKLKEKKKVSFFGAENFFNNIYHVKDLSKLIKFLLYKKKIKNLTNINIGTNKPIKIKKVFDILPMKYQKLLKEKKNKKLENITLNVKNLNRLYKKNTSTIKTLKKYFKETNIIN